MCIFTWTFPPLHPRYTSQFVTVFKMFIFSFSFFFHIFHFLTKIHNNTLMSLSKAFYFLLKKRMRVKLITYMLLS